MNDLARLSAAQRRTMIDEFVDATFAGTDPDAPGAGIAHAMRTLPTELPDDPTTEQVAAWIELAELVGDPAFRARAREMAVAGASADAPTAYEHAGAALAAGLAPDASEARAVVDRLAPPGVDRTELAGTISTFSDRRVERYWTLLGILKRLGPFPGIGAGLRVVRRGAVRPPLIPVSPSGRSPRARPP